LAQTLLEPAQAGRLPRQAAAQTYESLGDVHVMLDEYGEARERYAQALPIYREIGARLGEANCHFGLADLERAAGNYAAAEELYYQALAIYQAAAMPFNVALA
jgi:tetratricopeptide (TPR) repeat protein